MWSHNQKRPSGVIGSDERAALGRPQLAAHGPEALGKLGAGVRIEPPVPTTLFY